MTKVAVLDDWKNIARQSADWTPLQGRAEVAFFERPFRNSDDTAGALADFEVLIPMRERTQFPKAMLDRLPIAVSRLASPSAGKTGPRAEVPGPGGRSKHSPHIA